MDEATKFMIRMIILFLFAAFTLWVIQYQPPTREKDPVVTQKELEYKGESV
ncbi:hypothetical protein FHV99_004658 [Ochrobactrum sp. P20RRXII]|nr:hypothetical protein [Ochrobactrum sp. P20RRXII]